MITSLSGPSKTGKTVLLKRVIDQNNLIYLRGAYIKSLEDFWRAVLAWFETPDSESTSSSLTVGGSLSARGSGEVGTSWLAKGKVEAEGSGGASTTNTKTKHIPIDPFEQIVREISESDFTILIDDYHYMPTSTQKDVAKAIKSLAESSVNICTASVPHRSEDLLRANSELKGRIVAIDIPEWNIDELTAIAERGFGALNIGINKNTIKRIANEAMGSPQLMQVICLNLCVELGITNSANDEKKTISVTDSTLQRALEASANFASSADLVQALHSGPKVKGQQRTQYSFTDGSRGDVYRAILLAVTSDPISRDFTYDEIYRRVKSVCEKEFPTGQSISNSLNHMCLIAQEIAQEQTVMEWDDANLHIADPYLAFYMRASAKIDQLKRL